MLTSFFFVEISRCDTLTPFVISCPFTSLSDFPLSSPSFPVYPSVSLLSGGFLFRCWERAAGGSGAVQHPAERQPVAQSQSRAERQGGVASIG